MEYLKLANTDIMVSRFCMGGCPMGGYGWGETDEQDFIEAIHLALENGVNFFDTANTYGLGQGEVTLGKGIKGHRQEVVIQSKFGVRVMKDMDGMKTVYDNSAGYIRDAIEGTLKRLNTDYIDIYTIHYRDSSTPLEEVVGTLKSLQKEGKIRYFGLSNVQCDAFPELLPFRGEFVTNQEEFSLACREHESDLKWVAGRINTTPMTWGSLGQGILTGKYDRNVRFGPSDRRSRDVYVNFHGKKLEKNLKIVDKMRPIAERHGKSIPSCAIRFILDYLPDSVVIAGVKNPDQLRSNLDAFGWGMDESEVEALDEISSVRHFSASGG